MEDKKYVSLKNKVFKYVLKLHYGLTIHLPLPLQIWFA